MMTARRNNVYKKLIISHTAIILVVSLLLGLAAFAYFNWNYKEDIKTYNEQLLAQKKINFNSTIINKLTEDSYAILSNFQGRNDVTKLFDTALEPSDWKITRAYVFLNNMMSQDSQMIESISVYCPENQLFLSTTSGANHMNPTSPGVQWMVSRMEDFMMTNQRLVYERPVDIYMSGDTSPRIMLYTSYPLSPISGVEGRNGLLCITIRNSFVENLLNDNTNSELNMTVLLSPEGELINPLSGFPEKALEDESFQNLLESAGSFLYTLNNLQYVISLQSADYPDSTVFTGFQLLNASPASTYRHSSSLFVWFLIAVCVSSFLIGLLLAWQSSKRLYRPLKETVTKITSDLTNFSTENEYGIINDYINQLHLKASNNLSLICQAVIGNLLTAPLDAQEIEKQLFSAGIDFPHPAFMTCSVELDPTQPLSSSALLKLADDICMLSDSTMCLHAAPLRDRQVGILINGNIFPHNLSEQILNAIQASCGTSAKIFSSSRIEDIEDINRNYAMLQRMRRYEYFFPDQIFFNMSDFYKKDLSMAYLSSKVPTNPATLLRNRKIDEIASLLQSIKSDIQENDYSFESCNNRITKMIYFLSEYIKEIHLENEFPLEAVHNMLGSLPNINVFIKKYLETVEAIYQMLDRRSQSQNAGVVQQIQDYIMANLKNDISLEDAANIVSLSPPYVSRLFRDTMGITFVAFIKKCKMEKAKELLCQNDKNVDQVAEELGYNSTAYFIKIFKDTFGVTPKAYQRQKP